MYKRRAGKNTWGMSPCSDSTRAFSIFSILFAINHTKEKEKIHNTLEIYDNLKTKDYNFKGGNGKEAYIEAGGFWTTGFLVI